VVLEEINMNEDDPSDVAHELFVKALWDSHPLAPPILGTPESISGMNRDTIHGYWARRYAPSSVVVSAAGRIDHDDLVMRIGDAMGEWEGGTTSRSPVLAAIDSKVEVTRRDTEQAHLVLGSEGLPRGDDRRFALTIVDHVLGGGMSSRLFREIREQRGLAYAVNSFRMPFLETGAVAVYAGTTPTQASEVLKLIRAEFDKMMESGPSTDELKRAKGNVEGSLALSLEESSSRMSRLGREELTGIEHLSVDEVVERIEAITIDEAVEVAREVYSGPYVLGAVGPFEASDLEEHVT